MLKNIPAVVYARYSSSNQREESIEDQLRECYKFADREGYNVIGQYCDHAISGRTDDRPEFLRMICDAEKQLFKAVIVYRLDRFARNRFDSVLYKSRLAQYKVNVVSATECIPEGSDGVLIEALHEALAQKYSDDLSQIIRRGLYGNAEHCKSNGPLPFGYKANPTTRLAEIDEETAPIVKQIFTMIAEGSNYNQALAYCTRMGYPKTKNALYHILRNERYKGIYIYANKRTEGGIPCIVSEELFAAANATRQKHINKPNAGSYKYLLTGKLYCKDCENLYSGGYGTSRWGKKSYYYVCSGKKRKHICAAANINAPKIESMVVDALYMFILNEDIISAIIDAALECQERNSPHKNNIMVINRRIAEIEKKLNNLLKAIEAGVLTETTMSRMQELEEKKKSLQRSLMKEKLKAPKISRSQLEFFFEKLRGEDPHARKFQKCLIDTFVNRIYPDGNTVKMVVNLGAPDDETLTYSKLSPCFAGFDKRNFWWR